MYSLGLAATVICEEVKALTAGENRSALPWNYSSRLLWPEHWWRGMFHELESTDLREFYYWTFYKWFAKLLSSKAPTIFLCSKILLLSHWNIFFFREKPQSHVCWKEETFCCLHIKVNVIWGVVWLLLVQQVTLSKTFELSHIFQWELSALKIYNDSWYPKAHFLIMPTMLNTKGKSFCWPALKML